MKKRKYISIIAIILVVFISYNYLTPLGEGNRVLERHDYYLKTSDINNYNEYSSFRDEKEGHFIIYVEENKYPRATFTFHTEQSLILEFSIGEGSSMDDVILIVKKNKKNISHIILQDDTIHTLLVEVKPEETIEIISKKKKNNASSLVYFTITIKEPFFQFKNIIIPFIWTIFCIFLFIKRHSLIAINAYFIFLLILFSEKLNFGILIFLDVLIYTLFVMSIAILFMLLYQEFSHMRKFKIASFISFFTAFSLYVIPLTFIIYALNYDTKITKDILYAVFQSNGNESLEYISNSIELKWMILFVIIPVLSGILLLKQEHKETIKIDKYLSIFIVLTLFTIVFTQLLELRLPKFVVDNFERYQKELTLFREVQAKRKAGEIKFDAYKKNDGETYIVIIGESLNKKHMGIYGYLRDTTPYLAKIKEEKDLLIFQKTYANHTHTVPALSLALTQANQLNKKTYYRSLSIIDILNKANIETYWLTNQTLQGVWDNMVSVLASESDHLIGLNHSIGAQMSTQRYDGDLIDEVKKALDDTKEKNKVIFVHLMGSHILYSSRYPEKNYSIFKDKLKQSEFGKRADVKGFHSMLNRYDNSVLYNDYVVGSLFEIIQKQKGSTGIIYIADHADDVIKQLGHDSGKFTFEMTDIPMIAWFSAEYKQRYKERYNTFSKHINTLYSNDFLYDTLIGLFSIKTDKYESKYDLSSPKYSLEADHAFTLHGEKLYTDKSNYRYWQTANTQYLIDSNQSTRIFPHRVNSVGKLKEIWQDGFRSFEMDVHFGDHNTSSFQVGHNHGVMGMKMEKFLSSINYSKIERVWLDFKNLDQYNYKQAITRLNYLDKKFNIKKKFIIESGTRSKFFKEFKNNGWHTSYYMPTNKIINLLQGKKVKEMKALASEIAKQTKSQDLSAISFDTRLYPFVKKYIEPIISKDIVYHVWYAPSLRSKSFSSQLQVNKLYLDKRVKTLLSSYESPFTL